MTGGTYSAEELEPVVCEECGEGNVIDGARKGCTICIRWTKIVHDLIREQANGFYEMACGNWASPTPEQEKEWFEEAARLRKLARSFEFAG
jgi:hypothetical protein